MQRDQILVKMIYYTNVLWLANKNKNKSSDINLAESRKEIHNQQLQKPLADLDVVNIVNQK